MALMKGEQFTERKPSNYFAPQYHLK